MVRISFISSGGERRDVDVEPGHSVMESAKTNSVEGIDADCGGCCQCGTCHVFVDEAWFERVGPPTPLEAATMEFVEDREPTSRLSCQITVTPDLDGLVLRLPESQR